MGQQESKSETSLPDGLTDGAAAGHGASEGFDRVVERLRGVVERLEAGQLGLEEALGAFEEGVALSRRATRILDEAEQRVELLLRGPEGDRVVPFPTGEPGSDGNADGRGDARVRTP